MDFDQIESFLAVARNLSFTKAAHQRGLSQPGISRQVQKIEQELGVSLLERHDHGVRLTSAGERFHAYARALVDQHARMLTDLGAANQRLAGVLRIIASTTPGVYLVPTLVAAFQERYSQVRPEIAIADSAEVIAAVDEGRWDLGFVGVPVGDRRLRASAIAEDEIVLAVPAFHPLARRQEVALAELAGLAFIEREEGSGTLDSLRSILAEHHLTLPSRRVAMVLSSCQAVVAAVRQGLGVGFVSAMALDQASDSEVVGVRIADVSIRRHLYLIYRDSPRLSPVASAFVREVEQRIPVRPVPVES